MSVPDDSADAGRDRLRTLIEGAQRQVANAARIPTPTAHDEPQDSSDGAGVADLGSVPSMVPGIRGYELIRELHRGGQGLVYEAVQRSTGRRVAIKLTREGPFAGLAERTRFEREVRLLAQLQHPFIVAIHDSGQAAGHDYFVMDLIDGVPLDEFVRQLANTRDRKSAVTEIVRLFVQICDAVNAAHLHGVIHRDLKPGNICVDAAGVPRILDFGLAKRVDAGGAALDRQVTITQAGQFVGSLPWASPEQAAGHAEKVDIRTDVYSLGVVLFHALTGAFPYDVAAPLDEVLKHIRHTPPIRPSAAGGPTDAELDTIVLKCLAKEPQRRYQGAGELGRELARYLAGEPILACGDSAWYTLKANLRRYRAAVIAASVVMVTLAASTAFAIRQAVAARRSEQEARRQYEAAERISEFYSGLLLNLDPWDERSTRLAKTPSELRLPDLLLEAARRVPEHFNDRPDLAARVRRNIGRALNGVGLAHDAERVFREGHAAACAALGPDDPATLELLRNWGNSLVNPSPTPEGLRILEDVMTRTVSLLGEDHEQSLLAMMSLNYPLSRGEQTEKSLRLSERIIAVAERTRQANDVLYIEALSQHAVVLESTHRFVEAEHFARRAVESARAIGGGRSGYLAFALYAQWSALYAAERWEESLSVARERSEVQHGVYGSEHSQYWLAAGGVADSLIWVGRIDEAMALLRELKSEIQRAQGSNETYLDEILLHVCRGLSRAGEAREAERLMRECLERPDGGGPLRGQFLAFLAHAMDVQGRAEEAEAAALGLLREDQSESSGLSVLRWSTLDPTFHWLIGRCLIPLGRYKDAEWRLLAVERRIASNPVANEPSTELVRAALVTLYEAWHAAEPSRDYDARAAVWRPKSRFEGTGTHSGSDGVTDGTDNPK